MKSFLFFTFLFLTGSAVLSQDLYTYANAASVSNENNSTSGWSGPAEIESTDDEKKSGQHSIRIESDDEDRHGQFSFQASSGTTYAITIWAKRGQGGNAEFDEWEGFADFQKRNISGQGWNEYLFILTATSDNPVIKVFASKNNQDREVFVDAITIFVYEEEDNEPPTNPSNLNASNVTNSSLTLSWSGSSDNVGVAGYKIYRNNTSIGQTASLSFNVASLSPATTYSFYVKAYDDAGNHSGASNIISVTTLADGSGGGSGGGGGGTGGQAVYHVGNANLPTVNWQALNLYSAGSVGIGTVPNPDFRLSVNGTARVKELIVESDWSDFVFEQGYYLPTLKEVKQYIIQHRHLKDIPSAQDVELNGVEVGEMNKLLLQKIEELTLYMIEADQQIEKLNIQLSDTEKRLEFLEKESGR